MIIFAIDVLTVATSNVIGTLNGIPLSTKTKKPLFIKGFFATTGGDEGIRTLDPGFARMLP